MSFGIWYKHHSPTVKYLYTLTPVGIILWLLILQSMILIWSKEVEAQILPSGFSEQTIFSGLNEPTVVQFAPDGRVFVAEKSGLIKVFSNLSASTPTTFADLRTNVYNHGKSGLMGMALDPSFPTKPYVYVLYTYDAPPGGTAPVWGDSCPAGNADNCVVSGRLSRLQANGSVMTGVEQVLVADWYQRYPNQPVGGLGFGPDGVLYASAGDGANATTIDIGQGTSPSPDPANEGGALRSQDLRTPADPVGLSGSIISINPDNGAPLPLETSMTVDAPTVDANGVKSYVVTSVFLGSEPTVVRVLEPTNPAAGKRHKFLYVLPVDPGVTNLSSFYSDGLEELRLLDVPNRYNVTLIAPSFPISSWAADHASNPDLRHESFIVRDLVPFGDGFAAAGEIHERWLIGFSKSGNGSLTLILRNPNMFSAAAAWDAPAQFTSIFDYPTLDEIYGTEGNFDRYEIPSLVVTNTEPFRTRDRIWISGDNSAWTSHMIQLDSQMTQAGVLHAFAQGATREHSWKSGWLEGAVASLDAKASANYYPSGTVTVFPSSTTVLTGTLSSGTAAALATDDNVYYAVNSTTTGTRTAAWYASFGAIPNELTSLSISYKGNNSRNCTQTIAIWRWTTNAWVQLDSRTVGTTEVGINNLIPTGTLADYVNGTSGAGELRVRVQCQTTANLTNRGDLMSIVYSGPAAPPSGATSSPVDQNAQRIIAYGLRNPTRFAFRPGTDEIWVGDAGLDREEINRIPNAMDGSVENFGWPCYDGGATTGYSGTGICTNLYSDSNWVVTPPEFSYQQAEAVVPGDQCAVGSATMSGIAFYQVGTYPAGYQGALFFSDSSRNCIWVMLPGPEGIPVPASRMPFVVGASSPVDLAIGPGGDLFFVDGNGGTVRRIVFGGSQNDTSPPVRSNGLPTGPLAAGTTQTTLSLVTDENASCHYATTAGVAYDSMPNVFAATGFRAHSTTVTGLTNGVTYSYFVRCRDTIGNANTADFTISFSVADAPASVTYQASADFSSTQGFRNWYYLYGSGTQMVFGDGVWRGNETYLVLWGSGGHPGNVADAIRRWKAPQAGSITISGNAWDLDSGCGAGVSVYIKKNSTVLWQQAIANGNTTGVNFNITTTVVAGDNIDFGINRGADGNWNCDATVTDPTIVLTPADGAPSDATGPAVVISSHSNNQTVTTSTVTIAGTATDSGLGNSGVSSVMVNGVAATGGTATGSATANWSRAITLNPGTNTITVVGRDNSAAQNATTVSITLNYSGSSATYQASADFSSTQGFRNWYYLYGSGTQMVFDDGVWRGNETYLVLWENGGHPGNVSDAIRRWKAPQAGSITISGNVWDLDGSCGAGVSVYIKKNSTVLWQQAIANGNVAGMNFNITTTVVAGDNIDFGINRGEDGFWNCDATTVDPTITLMP